MTGSLRRSRLIITAITTVVATALIAGVLMLPSASAQAQSPEDCDYSATVTTTTCGPCTVTTTTCGPCTVTTTTCGGCTVTTTSCGGCTVTTTSCGGCTTTTTSCGGCTTTTTTCDDPPDDPPDYPPGDYNEPPGDVMYASVVGLGGSDGGGPFGGVPGDPLSWLIVGALSALATGVAAARAAGPRRLTTA